MSIETLIEEAKADESARQRKAAKQEATETNNKQRQAKKHERLGHEYADIIERNDELCERVSAILQQVEKTDSALAYYPRVLVVLDHSADELSQKPALVAELVTAYHLLPTSDRPEITFYKATQEDASVIAGMTPDQYSHDAGPKIMWGMTEIKEVTAFCPSSEGVSGLTVLESAGDVISRGPLRPIARAIHMRRCSDQLDAFSEGLELMEAGMQDHSQNPALSDWLAERL